MRTRDQSSFRNTLVSQSAFFEQVTISFPGDLDLLGMMSIRDRAELRQILAKHKLLFLRPWYREEQMIEEDKGMLYIDFICIKN